MKKKLRKGEGRGRRPSLEKNGQAWLLEPRICSFSWVWPSIQLPEADPELGSPPQAGPAEGKC